jgi:DNA-binding LytR/AlgR family response regulator
MKCIVVDDDKVSRMLLEKYISKTKFLEFKGAYENPVELLNDEKLSEIDLLFLDIEMPEMNGIDFLKTFNHLPAVIVISAKDDYALQSLDLDAVDYLMKPIEYTRFLKAVNKIKEYKESNDNKLDKGIFIKDGSSSFIRLKYEDIVWIEALENYVVIMTDEVKHTIHFTMKSLETQMPEDKFIRVHRSFIVNIDRIEAIEDNYIVITYNGRKKSFPIAKSFRDNLLTRIKIISK